MKIPDYSKKKNKITYLEMIEEIARLNKGYCELKEKCNKGECDCTHEEYNNMCEENIKMDLEIKRLKEEYMMLQNASDKVEEEKDREIERLNNIINGLDNTIENLEEVIKCKDNIIDKAIDCIYNELLVFGDETQWEDWEVRKYVFKALDILKGSDKE